MRRVSALCAALPLLVGCAGGPGHLGAATSPAAPSAPPQPSVPAPSGKPPPPAGVSKVLLVVEENHSIGAVLAGMPFLVSLAHRYGLATDYHAASHPSLPNYLELAGGSTFGVHDDGPPAVHPIHARSVFGLAVAHHRSARVYAESMPGRCDTSDAGPYVVRHNPWAYFVAERAACAAGDVSTGGLLAAARAGTLPAVGMVVPNVNNDAHDGTLAQADTWLRGVLPTVLAGPDFRSGRLAVVITFDEGVASQTVFTAVLQRSLIRRVVAGPLGHASTYASLRAVAVGGRPAGLLAAFGI